VWGSDVVWGTNLVWGTNIVWGGALQKLGASCEAVLRQSFRRDGVRMDQMLWSIVRGVRIVGHGQPRSRIH